MTSEQNHRYGASLKHSDTEETIDLWFYRPVGYRVALLGQRWGWSPNAITIVGLFLGAFAGVLFYPSDWRINLLGMVFLVVADICDSADGQLARLTGKFSRIGRILDGACGDVWFISIYVCICMRLTPSAGFWIWILAASGGYCHRVQAALADYYRNFHLFMVNGKRGSELDDADLLLEQYKKVSWRVSPLKKLIQWIYLGYTRLQEKLTPNLQFFRKRILQTNGDAVISPQLSELFRQQSLPLLKFTNILTFNWRAITLFISLMSGMPWLYFVVELTVFNAMLFYMRQKYEHIASTLLSKV
ncbi:MAG: CDP-alcohol phosphatidyltransferase family protein [Bacteroidales bacterium]|nr:CDP-alcohol phosphatidyltransferase family protein [Bacteroidales bacterium]